MNLESSYWNFRKQEFPRLFKDFHLCSETNWCNKLLAILPSGTCQPIKLQQYAKDIDSLYSSYQPSLIPEETFFLSLYLPNKETDFMIKSRDLKGVNYLRFDVEPQKHMSINKIPVALK